MLRSTLTDPLPGPNHPLLPAEQTASYRALSDNNSIMIAMKRGLNSQLRTHFGYYVSPSPTIEQLKK